MTQEEISALTMFADTFYQNQVNVLCTCVMYGLYILSFLTALYMFWSKPIKAHKKTLLSLFVIVFLSSTWDWIDRITSPLPTIHIGLIHPKDSTNLSANITDAMNAPGYLQSFSFWGPAVNVCALLESDHTIPGILTVMYLLSKLLIGDSLVLWRVWSICDVHDRRKRRVFGFVLISLMTGNIAVNVADALIDDLGPVNLSTNAIPLDWISLVISLIINALATFLIGLKAWTIYQNIYHLNARYFQLKKILLILIESGLLFCIIQIFYAIINALEINNVDVLSGISMTYATFTAVANGCAALYPVAIIIIVHMEASPLIFSPGRDTSGWDSDQRFTSAAIEMQDMTDTQDMTRISRLSVIDTEFLAISNSDSFDTA